MREPKDQCVPNSILLVDARGTSRALLDRLVEQHFPEHRLVTATSAEEAVQQAAESPPDCALVDVQLPDEDGIALCRRLKASEEIPPFPVMLWSSRPTGQEERLAGLDAGADDFLDWPVESLELVAKIGVMLRVKLAEDELRAANRRLAELAEQRTRELHGIHQRFRHMVEATDNGVVLFELDRENLRGIIREANTAFCQMLGYNQEEILQKGVHDLIPEERLRLLHARAESILSKRHLYFETVLLTRDGRRMPVGANARVIFEEGRQRVLVVFHPGSAEGEGRFQETNTSYRILARETGQLIYEIDVTTMRHRVAGAVKQVTGLSRDEVEALQGAKWFPLIHEEDQRRVYETFKAALEAIGKYELQYRFHHKSEGIRVVEDVGVVIPNEEGVAYRVVGTLKDITARVHAEEERQRLEREQQHSQRLESLGILAGGIAHDFNNILAGIIGLTDLTLRELPAGSPLHEDLSEALRGGHRAKELVRQILAFSRQTTEERSVLYLHLVVREGLRLIRATLPSNIEIIETIDVESGAIHANSAQVHQVLTNFCTNAAQAMPQGGKLEVVVRDAAVGSGTPPRHPNLRPGEYVILQVRDTGHGMSGTVLERIFDPFFTTKRPGEGTGMGLAVVHGIVSGHGGVIEVESKPEQGASFCTYLPKVKAVPHVKAPQENAPPAAGLERLMLVDDEETVLRLGLAGLPRLGYQVTGFSDPLAALEHFRAAPDEFDAVVTDYMMPNLTGDNLAAEMRGIRPGIPIILFTGFSDVMTEEKAKNNGIAEVVYKPVVIQELAGAIRRAIDGAPKPVQ